MAQRWNKDQLMEMMRVIVRQEIHETVLKTIHEVLSERYLKELAGRMIAESAVSARPRGTNNLSIQGDEEEEQDVPHPLANSILGVGQDDPAYEKDPKDDGVRQYNEEEEEIDESVDPMSVFFQGTRPLDEREAEAPSIEEQMARKPLPKPLQEQTSVWKRMNAGMEEMARQRKLAAVHNGVAPVTDLAAEEARLKKLRADLDRKA